MKKSCLIIIVSVVIAAFGMNSGLAKEKKKQTEQVENEMCLTCHSKVFEGKTKRKGIAMLHQRHVKSKRTEYGGKNKMCITCHEAWVMTDDVGWTDSPIYHPDTAMKPGGFWKKHIQRKDIAPVFLYTDPEHHKKPYTLKPLMDSLVCIDCHGPDSKVKVLYGTKTDL